MAGAELLFVYGSLKQGQRHHGVLAGARFVSAARTSFDYRLLDLGAYPALAPGSRSIAGELFAVDAELLGRVDRFEGCDYERRQVELWDGRRAHAYLAVDAIRPGARELELDAWSEPAALVPACS
jgi:gamma-glutamylcyclotransferase (GGCT)/AIG2-like uncharacterized protein YtfP